MNKNPNTYPQGLPVKPCVSALSPYSVLQEIDGIKLNQNESPYDVPPELKEEIFRRLVGLEWNRYPPGKPVSLLRKISRYTGFPQEGILAGNSSNELIQVIIAACCDSGDAILTVSPTFSVYGRVAAALNVSTTAVPLLDDYSFDVPELLKQIRSGAYSAVILTSPNNPTGTVLEMEGFKAIAESVPVDTLLVVDEAYFEFHRQSLQTFIDDYPNLAVLRTFSKSLGAAGIRLGYLMGSSAVVRQLEKVKLPFSVGIFQQTAGEVLLENVDALSKNLEVILSQRERMFSALSAMPGMVPVPSRTNFILFGSKRVPAIVLYRRLVEVGVLVRAYDGPDLCAKLRVTVGLPSENTRFLEVIEAISREVDQ